jgi:hypothetical protein
MGIVISFYRQEKLRLSLVKVASLGSKCRCVCLFVDGVHSLVYPKAAHLW